MRYTCSCKRVVNAEVDLMGGVIEGGVGDGTKTSSWSASLEKVQEKLRQEFDVREESRRQLEFLEKGGDPLQFKHGNAASVSVQSTSPTQPDQFVISEAKCSFAFTASPHGDSVESIGRPGATLLCEPNSADNLLLFDGENEIEGERISRHLTGTAVATLEQSTQIHGNPSAKELGDSAAFDVPRKAYKRRVRPRLNRDGARSSSNDVIVSAGRGSLPSHSGFSDAKGVVVDSENKAVRNGTGLPTSANGGVTCKSVPSDNQDYLESGGMKAAESASDMMKDSEHTMPDSIYSKDVVNIQQGQHSVVVSQATPIEVACVGPESLPEKEKIGPTGQLYVDPVKVENLSGSSQINGFINAKGDRKNPANNRATFPTKGLESESSCTHTSLGLDGNNDSEMYTNLRLLDSNGSIKVESSAPEGITITEMKDVKDSKADDTCPSNGEGCEPLCENDQNTDFGLKPMEELVSSQSDIQNKVKDKIFIEGKESVARPSSETESKQSVPVGDNSNPQNDNTCGVGLQDSIDSSIPQLVESASLVAFSHGPSEGHRSGVNIKLVSKADEDSILEEARIIEAKHKRIAELSAVTSPVENPRRSHWDYVLEEMAWLANDVAQERLWKITAASQISYQAAFTFRSRFQEQNSSRKQKIIAHNLASIVMDFWHSVKNSSKMLEQQCSKEGSGLAIKEYAERFLKYNNTDALYSETEVAATPERIFDSEVTGLSWEDHLTEENLFYTVPPNAIEMYRKSIESHVLQCERVGSSMQDEVEMSACEAVADFGSQDYIYEEDQGEANTYNLQVSFEGSNPSRFAQKKHKIQMRANNGRPYDVGADLSFSHCIENKVANQQLLFQAKRPVSSLNVSFPTKRVRTGSRQRVLSPFIGSTSGLQLPLKTDASSGETSSYQDDQSTLHGGLHMQNTLEVESVGDFEKLQFDSTEVFSKHKKKKKANFLNSSYEQRWHDDSSFQNEQRENSKKRLDGLQIESNCSSGMFAGQIPKKPKISRPSLENSFDNMSPVVGSIPSPVASQMSNMSNPNKILKMLTGRDRSRKGKNLKSHAGHLTLGSQWSLFEDQALVVLVHDMGPNWELVSDAINSTLQFKCIHRKPKECKERHKILMDKTNGDAADSADESGSSQPYPSTLPGIPKGSARQLFQRLKGPMEEDTLKSHFEKIILIGKKYLIHKTPGDNRDPKQLQQPHSSHAHALSQVFPNNMGGGPMLTPLDLCDASPPSSDVVSHGYQSPSTSTISNPDLLGAAATASGTNSVVQGSSNTVAGKNISSSSNPPNTTARDGGRYSVSTTPLTEQQRMHPYNRMLSGRSTQQSNNPSAPGSFPGANPGVRVLPGGNGMGIMCGNNRGMPVRPGAMVTPLPKSVILQSVMASNKGSSVPEHQPPGNIQVIPSIGGLNSSYPNQIGAPPSSSYPAHQKHALIQLAKDRQLQQRLLQQQFGASNPMIPPSIQQQQLPVSSPSQITSQTSPPTSLSTMPSSSSMSPVPHHQLKQLKHPIPPPHGLARGSGSTNQVSKPRPRPPQLQQTSRSHLQPRQQLQPHQQVKLMKGAGRGNMTGHQTVQRDPSVTNGFSTNSGNQAEEKGDQVMQSMQNQSPKPSSAALITQIPQPQQKIYSVKISSQTESLQQKPSHSDDANQGHVPPTSLGPTPSAVNSLNHQPQSQPRLQHKNLINQSQHNSQRVVKHPACNSSLMAAPQDCNNAANTAPAQWKVAEPLFDSGEAQPQAQDTNLADSELGTQVDPGISQRSSANLSPEGNIVSEQLQQQQPQFALHKPQQQQLQNSVQQPQALHAGNSSLYARPSSSGPD